MTIRSYRDLDVWQKAIELVTNIYSVTKLYPKEELYGLVSQIRRSAVSIPSNIAEGRGKRSTGEFIRFLNIAYGSAAELETQIIISNNLGYISSQKLEPLLKDTGMICRMLNGLIASLERKRPESRIPNPESIIDHAQKNRP